MLTKERLFYLLDKVEQNRIIHVKELAKELDVSESTIRRDLAELEESGKLRRIRGGAIKSSGGDIVTDHKEILMQDRMRIHYDLKERICKKAAALVKDGECVFIDGGTTLVPLMEYLQDRPVRIVTHNYLAVAKLRNPKALVTVIGGEYMPRYDMGSGTMAAADLEQFQFDHAFIGCAGIDSTTGIAYTTEMETREMKKIAMENSAHSYLLIDHSKMQVHGFCKFSPLVAFDYVITDENDLETEYTENFLIAE